MTPRRPDLDALRGVAVALVVLDHLRVPHTSSAGTLGVTAFFVLSGWLITRLLVAEHARSGAVDLRAFWARRARRLLPALLVLLAVVSAIAAVRHDPLIARPATVVGAVLFVNNWAAASDITLGALHHTWSLAVEEQFYLVWPLLVVVGLSRGRRAVVGVAAAGLLLSAAQTVHLAMAGAVPARIYAGTDTRASALLAGCLLALLTPPEGFGRHWRAAALLLGAGALVLMVGDTHGWESLVLSPWIATLAACGVIATAALPASRPLEHLGRRSYGVYLWHHPLLVLVLPRVDGPWHWPAGIALVVVALLLAEASWRFVEEPVLRRGPGNARTPDHGVGGPNGRRTMPADA